VNYQLSVTIDGYDIDAEGDTWIEMLAAYEAECRRVAATHQGFVERLLAEAGRAQRLAKWSEVDGR